MIEGRKPTFIPVDNIVHINEKWLYLNPNKRRFYVLPTKIDHYRVCMSKRYKMKAMFVGVTSRNLFNENNIMI